MVYGYVTISRIIRLKHIEKTYLYILPPYIMKKQLSAISIFTLLLLSSITFAWWSDVVTTDKMAPTQDRVPPVQNAITYTFNETWVKQILNQTSTLIQITCNSEAILKSLWFTQTNKKIYNLWLEEWNFEYNFDIRNCSLRWNKVNNTYQYNKSLTEAQAISFAETFIKDPYLKSKIFYQLGKPIVVFKNSNSWPYPLYKEATPARDSNVFDGIEIDESNQENIEPQYISFSIMYPYLLNWKEIYEQYGNRAWVTLEVSADWVMSVNARLLSFKWATKKSEKLTSEDAIRILKNGWNSPFRWQTNEIKLSKPEKVIVMFNIRRDNKTLLFMSSGIWLKSNVKPDQRAQQPYTMILSDYKIWNTAQ